MELYDSVNYDFYEFPPPKNSFLRKIQQYFLEILGPLNWYSANFSRLRGLLPLGNLENTFEQKLRESGNWPENSFIRKARLLAHCSPRATLSALPGKFQSRPRKSVYINDSALPWQRQLAQAQDFHCRRDPFPLWRREMRICHCRNRHMCSFRSARVHSWSGTFAQTFWAPRWFHSRSFMFYPRFLKASGRQQFPR